MRGHACSLGKEGYQESQNVAKGVASPGRSKNEMAASIALTNGVELKKLGSSNVHVPAIGMGTWRYTGGLEPLRRGIEHGACLIDTAEIYGTEEIVGQAIRGRRDRVFVASKVAPRHFRRRELITAADNSLKRLELDHIDLYQLHWPNHTVPIEETMAAMQELVDAGKVRFIGISNFSLPDLKRAEGVFSKYRIVSNQVRYSLIERTVENGLLEYCRQRQITIIAHSPLGVSFPTITAADPEQMLAQIAERTGKTAAQIALNWLIAKENVIAIPRASVISHTIENCAASGWRLSLSEYGLLESNLRCKRRGWVSSTAARWKRHVSQRLGRQL
jgi:diketogulonate reductase-like aldo/keto reductase